MITRIDNKASTARVFFVYWLFDDQDNCLYVGCVGIESARESRERSRPFYAGALQARLRREALEAQTSS